MWNVETGAAVGEPLMGNTGPISSVAFSPDGTQIVSGSEDNTIRVWNVETGAAVGEPLMGHTGPICPLHSPPTVPKLCLALRTTQSECGM